MFDSFHEQSVHEETDKASAKRPAEGSEIKFGRPKRFNELFSQMELVQRYIARYNSELYESLSDKDSLLLDDLESELNYYGHGLALKIGAQLTNDDYEAQGLPEFVHNFVRQKPYHAELFSKIYKLARLEYEQGAEAFLRESAATSKSREKIDVNLEKRILDSVISLDRDLPAEQSEKLKTLFPSGNFLVHSTNLNSLISVITDGALLTSIEVAHKKQRPWGAGGADGIAFNLNKVRILQGDPFHLVGFVAAPELILDADHECIVPMYAAQYEVRLRAKKVLHVGIDRPADSDDWKRLKHAERLALPRVSVGNMFILCPAHDASAIAHLCAEAHKEPLGILTYSGSEVRIPSWHQPFGDHKVLSDKLEHTFADATGQPTLTWEKNMFQDGQRQPVQMQPRSPFVHEEDTARTLSLRLINGKPVAVKTATSKTEVNPDPYSFN